MTNDAGSRLPAVVRGLQAPLTARSWAAIAAAVAVLMAAAVCCAFALDARAPVAARAGTADQLQRQAGPIVAAVFSARAETWQADRARARTLVTGAFATSVTTGLSAGPPAGVKSVRWEPLQVGVVEARARAGTALVVARVVVTAGPGAESSSAVKSVSADFVRSGDRWLLSGLDELQ
ncbi:hypothetical protein [Gordonia sp. (in: high G+C Gram-positive bacteria)]|uniref:hypothetical protein n=1 Tax=Gordonia sp. (in: high G+C Gram-positive bacteria) TaxID=84139 RepID=UPI003527098B